MEQNVALDLARQEAEMAIQARNDFLAVMNHEMRTPMHAIIALLSLILETELTPAQRVMIETVLKSSNVLATLINDVLDLSRMEDGSLELEMGKLNLHGVLEEVKDSGCGILPQDIPHLFTKFAQSRSGPAQPSSGAGLGLAICKRFVNLMGGHIWIESEGLDKGSTATFIVNLRICSNPDSSDHQAANRGQAYSGSGGLTRYKPFVKDDDGTGFSSRRNQRSF